MPRIQLLAAALVGAAALTVGTDHAIAQNYPWCAIVQVGASMGENCGFVSRAQCEATVQSQGGYCERNGRYRGGEGRARQGRSRRDN